MKAAVFHKTGHISVDNVEELKIEHPQDVILRVVPGGVDAVISHRQRLQHL